MDVSGQNPETFSKKYRSYREVRLSIFPLVIIYRYNKIKKSIRIVAVFHTSRQYKERYIDRDN
ncbi:MAG: type II toxin-antitoxin system RelE/ParE family toxin [Bacteroidetes bacterium]|nr:type II toxin-antitoxin system RelE/ParE family toxin [Bacteroidota bacterium]